MAVDLDLIANACGRLGAVPALIRMPFKVTFRLGGVRSAWLGIADNLTVKSEMRCFVSEGFYDRETRLIKGKVPYGREVELDISVSSIEYPFRLSFSGIDGTESKLSARRLFDGRTAYRFDVKGRHLVFQAGDRNFFYPQVARLTFISPD